MTMQSAVSAFELVRLRLNNGWEGVDSGTCSWRRVFKTNDRRLQSRFCEMTKPGGNATSRGLIGSDNYLPTCNTNTLLT